MSVRIRVETRAQIPGRGTMMLAVVLNSQEPVRTGDRFSDSATEASITIRGVEPHSRETPDGTQYSLLVTESTPEAIQGGAILLKEI